MIALLESEQFELPFMRTTHPVKTEGHDQNAQNPSPLAGRPHHHGSGSPRMVQVLPIGEPSVRLAEGWL
jgi:hypothetical protein